MRKIKKRFSLVGPDTTPNLLFLPNKTWFHLEPPVIIRKIIVVFILSFIIMDTVKPCTTFVINDSMNLVFGRNYDFDLGVGFICINKRGVAKQAFVNATQKRATWTSKYGSITFNQIGVDAPMGGMNEKGLVIAQLALFESEYPHREDQPTMNQLEWIQYQLDNSSGLAEVIESSKTIQIVPIATPVHYMVCDRLGNLGILEYLNGELVLYQGEDITIPVCSNMTYEASKMSITDYQGFGGRKPVPREWKSVQDIIAIASARIAGYESMMDVNPVKYSFEILESVGSPSRTQWSVVYDLLNKRIHFKTLNKHDVRTIEINGWDYSCSGNIEIINIQDTENNSQVESLTSEDYYDYKTNLINWFKANIDGFPDITDEVIGLEVENIFNRKCSNDSTSLN